ncbi:hypothetical protein BRC75_06285 [Halobacteriales archaeon QH_7_69_31]|nr:MAG: hypothetical protein BRC75_06285 [Halobacteriales archaeon QH_7_69_31]
MGPDADDDPFRLVAVVVGSLAVLFVALLVAVQVSGSPGSVLSIPLLLAVPVVVGALYYHVRFR